MKGLFDKPKKVSVENANRFLEFFEKLQRFYEVLSFEKIIELKELINHTLAIYKPQDKIMKYRQK